MTGNSSVSSSVSKRNPLARELSDAKFRLRIVKPRKGKGSYSRKGDSSWVK
jgi:stalled ribosome alternative rescue factor ArfA